MNSPSSNGNTSGFAGAIARMFIDSKLTPLLIIASILMGVAAIFMLPREEEPQIKVPMIDVLVAMPGFTAKEVEQRATHPMEKLIWEIPGVEYIYSTSRAGESMVIVRFKVGEDPEISLLKLAEKLRSNFNRIPAGVQPPLIKPRSIDDVSILAVTFHSTQADHLTLRRVAAEVEKSVNQVPFVGETTLIGGARRQLRIQLDSAALASRNLSALDILPSLEQANRQSRVGGLISSNQTVLLETSAFFSSARDVGNLVVGIHQQKPVYLRDLATILDDAEEPAQYVLHGAGAGGSAVTHAAAAGRMASDYESAAVTLSVAKRPGANAIDVADAVLRQVESLKGFIIPSTIETTVTRNYGETSAEKSNELLLHMGIAVISVSLLILVMLGWRESLVVVIAIPATLALTLMVFHLYGFTLNRITLFALIFSIGILVDDAIVVVENVVRHSRLPGSAARSWREVTLEAVSEVGNPTILATFAVIAAVLPMAFVGGLMGPYMRPIPVGASTAMFSSLLIAFVVIPWAVIRILPHHLNRDHVSTQPDPHAQPSPGEEDFFTRIYRRVMNALLHRPAIRWLFIAGTLLLLLAAVLTFPLGWVKAKMLPFDNKSEFQVILNMPEGSALEKTTAVAREMAAALRTEPEILNYQIYAGVAAPFNFNGLVRHYFLRNGPHIADLQINLLPKSERRAQSHEIASRIRPRLARIAAAHNARIAVAEVPPGPPVLQTLVAEIYAPSDSQRLALATRIRDLFRFTTGVVDVDWYVEENQPLVRWIVDKEKAALHGVSAAQVARTLAIAVQGQTIDLLHIPGESEDVPIVLEMPRNSRQSPEALLNLKVRSSSSSRSEGLVSLRELVRTESAHAEPSIHHKNLVPVTYVTGDVAGSVESPAYAIFEMNKALKQFSERELGAGNTTLRIYNASMPENDLAPALKWDGEWHITLEVFRDLGIAFAAILILIYGLMVGWFGSFTTPLIVMAAIPFSLVGILPAHGLMGAFFSATSMIGFMAGAGIVVRNSIILVDFIELRVREGHALDAAVVDAGAVRFRPMLLTALAVVAGAAIILTDPIFQGLALSLMAGEIASLLLSRMAVPVFYYMVHARSHGVSAPENSPQKDS